MTFKDRITMAQGDFLWRRAWAKCIVLISSMSPGDGAYSRMLRAVKSPPFLVGGGAVVTNDW